MARFALLLFAAAACAHAPVAPPPAPAPLAAPPPSAPAITEADLTARSHAVIDASDRGDRAALEAALAPKFVKFENQHLQERDKLLAGLTGPIHAPGMTRTWEEEHVYLRPDDAVFIGKAVEHETGNDSHGNRGFTGWYTLSWIRDHGDWKVAHWAWQPHRTSSDNARDMWNGVYRQSLGFNKQPNRLLVDTVRGVKPGAALDLMMGQGRNALYLAAQGWRVTGIDLSDEGIRLAREAAAAQKLPLTAIQTTVEDFDLGTARWDLVTMIYAGRDVELVKRIAPSIKRGGRFVLEYFADNLPETAGFKPGQLAQLFGPDFEIVKDETVDDVPDWAMNRAKLSRFVARRK